MPSEIVSHENNYAQDIAEFIKSNERLNDPTQRRDYFGQLTEDDFIDLVQRTASLVRTGSSDALQNFDGENAIVPQHEVPDQREKEALLRETWAVAKSHLNDNDVSDQDALDYAALTAAGGLGYIHPFVDGNGRTVRAMSYMISQGSSNAEELSGVLTRPLEGGTWSIDPEALVVNEKQTYLGHQPTRIEWEDTSIDEDPDDPVGIIANSKQHRNQVLRQMIENDGAHIEPQLDKSTRKNEDGTTALDGERFIEELVNDANGGMTNAKELLDIHREARADYVHRFLKAMQLKTPFDAHELIQNSQHEIAPDESEFRKNYTLTIRREIGLRAIGGKLTPVDRQLVQHKGMSTIRQVPSEEHIDDIA